MIIAIDGPSGCGKSTVARILAKRIGFYYLDSGALYRALTYGALKEKVSTKNEADLRALALSKKMRLELQPNTENRIWWEEIEISEKIRLPLINQHVSSVSAHPRVRRVLSDLQRKAGQGKDLVIEGRDTTTVVYPTADCKFFLDADEKVRAMRRLREFEARGIKLALEQILKEERIRDMRDRSRPVGRLMVPKGGFEIDTTSLSPEEVVLCLLAEIQNRIPSPHLFYHFAYRGLRPFVFKMFKLKTEGLENIPSRGGCIIAANHVSYLDPPLIGYSMEKRHLCYIARDSLFENLFGGLLLKGLNVHPIKRGSADRRALFLGIKLLLEGNGLVLFPEGTRSKTGELQEPKEGIGFIAVRSACPVIPAYVQGSFEAFPRDSKRIRFLPITIRYGRPVNLGSLLLMKEAEERGLYQEASQKIMDAIRALKSAPDNVK